MNTEKILNWTAGAEAMLGRVPVFVRPMAKKAVEKRARELNCGTIDEILMEEVRQAKHN